MPPSHSSPAVGPAVKSQQTIHPFTRASVHFGPLSASQQEEVAEAVRIFRYPFRPSDLASPVNQAGSWLWHGYLGRGMLTLLTSQWKSGKTTLVSVLLARMAQGGLLAGLPVAAGRAAMVSEEGRHDWDRRCRKLALGNHVGFYCRPFRTRPTTGLWLGMIDGLLERHEVEGLDLVVIDPLSLFLPGNSESSAVDAVAGLLPLRALLAAGMSVLLLHHPRKGKLQSGQAARGSGALSSQADIVLEMSYVSAPEDADRRRRLRAYSRHDHTRRDLTLELTADGTDYHECESPPDRESGDTLQGVRMVLERMPMPLTQERIFDLWPEEFMQPKRSTLARVLLRAVNEGVLTRTGKGLRNAPYEYELAPKPQRIDPASQF